MRVARWGNSLAIRLPSTVVEELGLKEGDEVGVRVSDEGRELRVTKPMTRKEAILQLRRFRGLVPADFKFDREEANER